ncbi:hypothetical protein [Teredinibacter turnerae]|uniref:hypothetical protein n=1 Tax=Teredinibacter turnerae TaxID=2426 RepID=UPI0030D27E48
MTNQTLDNVVEHVAQKGTIESIFNNLGQYLLCAGVIQVASSKDAATWFKVLSAFAIVFLLSLCAIYGVKHIIMPIQNKLGNLDVNTASMPFWKSIKHTLRELFLTKVGIFYTVSSLVYFLYSNELVKIAMAAASK